MNDDKHEELRKAAYELLELIYTTPDMSGHLKGINFKNLGTEKDTHKISDAIRKLRSLL